MPDVSLAEKGGMSFEIRCEEALSSLRLLWELFQKLSTENVRSKHAYSQKVDAIFANSTETARELFKPTTAHIFEKLTEIDEKFYTSLWAKGIESTRNIYGSDATDFALKTIESDRTKN